MQTATIERPRASERVVVPTDENRVLIVEDDASQARLLSRWLGRAGMLTAVAGDAVEGAALAAEGGWDCVLTDVRLPDGCGLAVADKSRLHHPQTPVVLMTAHGDMALAVRAVRAADELLLKPLERAAVLQTVDTLVGRARRAGAAGGDEVVLAIGAHPDDVEIGCGGILCAHRAAGSPVVILTLTGGGRGGDVARRRAEAAAAAHLMGAELVMGDLSDTRVDAGAQTIGLIRDVIERVRPTIVYTHSPHDVHQDHRAAHQATRVAARDVPNLYCYQSPSSTIAFHPTRFVDIGAELDRKLTLLALHGSQTGTRAYLAEAHIVATADYWGRFAGYGLVEPLEVVRETSRIAPAASSRRGVGPLE